MISRPTRRLAALAASAAVLAACAGGPTAGTAPSSTTPAAVAQPAVTPTTSAPVIAAIPAIPPPPKRTGPADLVGRTTQDIGAMFGQPRLLRREAPAEIWQFPGATCTLLVFFYPDEGGSAGSLRVRHADAVPPARGAAVGGEDCVESLLRGRVPVG